MAAPKLSPLTTVGSSVIPVTTVPYLRSSFASVESGAAQGYILAFGDSVMFGTDTAVGYFPKNCTYQLAQRLIGSLGISADAGSICGFGTTRTTVDPRFTTVNNVTLTAVTLGGTLAQLNSSSSSLVYTPGISTGSSPGMVWDTVKVLMYGGSGSARVTCTGGTAVTVAGNSTGFTSITATAASASASNTVTITMPTGANSYVVAIVPYLSTQTGLHVINCGVPGATLNTLWSSSAATYGPQQAFVALQTMLGVPLNVLAMLGKNDWFYTTTLNTFISQVQSFGSFVKNGAYGDFILASAIPDNNQQPLQQLMVEGMAATAYQNGWGYVDLWDRWGGLNGYNNLNPLGYYTDSVHPSQIGQCDVGNGFANLILSLV